MSSLRGSAGYLLVVDGTRCATLDTAVRIQQRIVDTLGDMPFVVLFNEADLTNEWEIANNAFEEHWGGAIGCTPRLAGGARFWFRLPRPADVTPSALQRHEGAT